MSRVALALLIRGCRNPAALDDASPVLWVEGDLNDASLLGLGSVVIEPRIPVSREGLGGFSWTSDLRDPLGEGAPLRLLLLDGDGRLGPLFGEDLTETDTDLWRLAAVELAPTQTTLTLYGAAVPAVGQILYLGAEALEVEAATDLGGGEVWSVEVARGACGSTPRYHRLRPKTYPVGAEGGMYSSLYVSSRPDWDGQKWHATVWQLRTEGTTAVEVLSRKDCFVTARPRPTGPAYSVELEDYSAVLARHELGDGKAEVTLARCATLGQVEQVAGTYQPRAVVLRLTRLEAELLFGRPLHQVDNPDLDTDLCEALVDALTAEIPWRWAIELEAGGWSGLFELHAISILTADYHPQGADSDAELGFLRLILHRLETWAGEVGPLSSAPNAVSAEGVPVRQDDLPPGWSDLEGDLVRSDEEGPRVSLWALGAGVSFPRAVLHLLTSELGSGAGGVYDVLASFGAGVPVDLLDVGSTPADPSAVDPLTSALLELEALFPQAQDYRLRTGDKLGDWLRGELLRTICLWSQHPTSGLFGAIQLDPGAPLSTPAALVPLVGRDGIVQPGTRFPRVEALLVEVGSVGKDRRAAASQLVRLVEADTAGRLSSPLRIRLWKDLAGYRPGTEFGDVLPKLAGFYLRQLRAAPSAWKVPCSILSGALRVGERRTWTNATIQTAQGRGVSALQVVIVGTDNDLATGIHSVLVLPLLAGLTNSSNGLIAPALAITGVESTGAGVGEGPYYAWVRSLGDPAYGPDAYESLLENVAAESGLVRVVSRAAHNPQPERAGWLEASAILRAVDKTEGGMRLTLEIDPAWERGGLTAFGDLLVPGQSAILLSDRRVAGANPQGVEIFPSPAQRSGGGARITRPAPPPPERPFDGVLYRYKV